MAVPSPVDIKVVWTAPNGSSLMTLSDLVMETPSRYTSEVELHSIDSTNVGEYTCTINFENETNVSAKKTLTVGKHMPLQRIHQGSLSIHTKSTNTGDAVFQISLEWVENSQLQTVSMT